MKNRGYFTLEAIIVLGLFVLILTSSSLLFSTNINVKNTIKNFTQGEINYKNNIIYFSKEIKNSKNIKLLRNRLSYEKNIIENNAIKLIIVKYYFSGTNLYREQSNKEKIEIFLDNIQGEFVLNNNLLRFNIKYKNREEEYVYFVQ